MPAHQTSPPTNPTNLQPTPTDPTPLHPQIFQILDVHPRNQQLHTKSGPVPGPDEISLAQAEIFPDEEIRIVNSGEVPDDEFESLFDAAGADGKGGKKRRERETGFANTVLGGGGGRRGAAAAAAAAAGEGKGEEGEGAEPMECEVVKETHLIQ